ncbi:MAG: hypothetical protein DHS20C17_08630 [Cyclobacteriaceae bacterium]|nr:MAG: hypothetical protein DHS20C17_08630 [Cyclobacteriaceae bacterium]
MRSIFISNSNLKKPGKFISQTLLWFSIIITGCSPNNQQPLVFDESANTESVDRMIMIDSVWAGHPVGFCLLTDKDRQYVAYYNATRNLVVGQRNLTDDKFTIQTLPATARETNNGTSTVLGWDSHNYLTMAVDKEGFIHLSGNVHAHPLTYFRSTEEGNVFSLLQVSKMTGLDENRTTYPKFLQTREGELIYTYRDGGSGNGNQIYNVYNCATKSWSRLLDTPLTDGQGLMNAYISSPRLAGDDWYHTYWVWRDTPDCSTNHDLSYMKSPDLKTWYNAFGERIELPATIDKKRAIVDPIPPKGGIINLAAKFVLDRANNPVFVYHKYDTAGNLQFYIARIDDNQWKYNQITNWDYRWEFQGNGSINKEVDIKNFTVRPDGYYEVDFWHLKYGHGTILLDDDFKNVGKVLKAESFETSLKPEGSFPGLMVQTADDIGENSLSGSRYMLKWETLNRNRDRPREKPWPDPSILYLYELTRN